MYFYSKQMQVGPVKKYALFRIFLLEMLMEPTSFPIFLPGIVIFNATEPVIDAS